MTDFRDDLTVCQVVLHGMLHVLVFLDHFQWLMIILYNYVTSRYAGMEFFKAKIEALSFYIVMYGSMDVFSICVSTSFYFLGVHMVVIAALTQLLIFRFIT